MGDAAGNDAIRVRPLTPSRWPDVEALFTARGCSVARQCWCMYYRRSGKAPAIPAGGTRAEVNRRALRALAGADPAAGLIAYRGRTPVGWISLGPREHFARLANSPVKKPVDDKPAWSIVCFVVPSEHRHQGVAHALLQGAIAYARKKRVKLLEAYPIDLAEPKRDADLWFGVKSMYDAAGFREVARRRPTRPIVRLAL